MLFKATITAINKKSRTSGSGIINSRRVKRVYTNGDGNTEIEYNKSSTIRLIEVSETEEAILALMSANDTTPAISVVIDNDGVLQETVVLIEEIVIGLPNKSFPDKTNITLQNSYSNIGATDYVVNETLDTILEKAGSKFTTTVNLVSGTNVISHNLGKRARVVAFDDGAGGDYIWIVNVGDPLNKIDVTSGEAVSNVTVNIIAF